ncbi:MAG TPA: M20/M25/M40 family metallo-hydrolase [Chitinophagaceae bacterium]|nr:M20/M25/M40 family metallo-hydrolase [Chitinophagaceae bacterium]
MRISTLGIIIILLTLTGCSSSRKIVKTTDPQTTDNLRAHIQYLADDKLEGRRTGTNGEDLAVDYIMAQFKAIGLLPKGTEYYPQYFIVNDGKKISETTSFSINGNVLTNKDFFPFPFSPDMSLEALPSIAIQEAGMPWFFDIKEILEENKTNPHFDLHDYIRTNSKKASDRGASAIILYNSSTIDDKLVFNPKDRSENLAVPVIYIAKPIADKYFTDKTATLNVKMRIGISGINRRGKNVIGYIDNGAARTVILGAHFDHLGYGEDGNSRNTQEPAIHNGADDNASGTAALIELGRKLKASGLKGHNYLFIAFSGEELGLYGSKYFTENATINLKDVDYMINMDMVGRLNDSSKVLTIGGYGTSPAWSTVINKEYFEKPNDTKKTAPSLIIRIDSSGTGPSDHTSFYRKDIPVLFYFTGLHSDYHKPSDDADKINYAGEALIIQHIMNVIGSLDMQPKLAFTKTRESQTSTNARMNVTMGIMPDYTYSGNGLRADGVSEGKPAHKAGLKAGDIILHVGDYAISSMESYMQMLGKYKKGDKVKVKYKRGNDTLETMVEF